MDDNKLKQWNEMFENLDINHSGVIEVKEIIKIFKENGYWCNQTRHLQELVNRDAGATIDYFEFLARIIDVHTDISEDEIRKAFKHFDTENANKITDLGLKKFFKLKGDKLSDTKASMILNQVDYDSDHDDSRIRSDSGVLSSDSCSRDEIGFNTFKDYILNDNSKKNSMCKPIDDSENTPLKRRSKITKMQTLTKISFCNQSTRDDDKLSYEAVGLTAE